MSEHKIELKWANQNQDFVYESYSRSHKVRFGGGIEIQASSAPEYLGRAEEVNPEELLAAAASSCHMLTFLAVAAKSRLHVKSYHDQATAVLEKNELGKMSVTKIFLKTKIEFEGATPDAAKLKDLHDKAHRNCFIANSISAKVEVIE